MEGATLLKLLGFEEDEAVRDDQKERSRYKLPAASSAYELDHVASRPAKDGASPRRLPAGGAYALAKSGMLRSPIKKPPTSPGSVGSPLHTNQDDSGLQTSISGGNNQDAMYSSKESLTRHRIFLDEKGQLTMGWESIETLREGNRNLDKRVPRLHLDLFRRPQEPERFTGLQRNDVQFVPSQSNPVLPIDSNLWPEPLLDRDHENHRAEYTALVLAGKEAISPQKSLLGCKMSRTRADGRSLPGKWRLNKRWMKREWKAEEGCVMKTHKLRRLGMMVSDTFLILTVCGTGISGRVYGAGVQNSRSITVEGYDPATCKKYVVELQMSDLERVFFENTDMLRAGKKSELIEEIVKRLSFEKLKACVAEAVQDGSVPGRSSIDHRASYSTNAGLKAGESLSKKPSTTSTQPTEESHPTAIMQTEKKKSSLVSAVNALNANEFAEEKDIIVERELKMNFEVQICDFAKRRIEWERQVLEEQERRLRERQLRMKRPKRLRDCLVCRGMKVMGYLILVAIYEFIDRKGSLLVRLYQAKGSYSYEYPIGLFEAAAAVGIETPSYIDLPPRKYPQELKKQIAFQVIEKMHLAFTSPNREVMMFALGDRLGSEKDSLLLPPLTSSLWECEQRDQFHLELKDTSIEKDYTLAMEKLEKEKVQKLVQLQNEINALDEELQKLIDTEEERNVIPDKEERRQAKEKAKARQKEITTQLKSSKKALTALPEQSERLKEEQTQKYERDKKEVSEMQKAFTKGITAVAGALGGTRWHPQIYGEEGKDPWRARGSHLLPLSHKRKRRMDVGKGELVAQGYVRVRKGYVVRYALFLPPRSEPEVANMFLEDKRKSQNKSFSIAENINGSEDNQKTTEKDRSISGNSTDRPSSASSLPSGNTQDAKGVVRDPQGLLMDLYVCGEAFCTSRFIPWSEFSIWCRQLEEQEREPQGQDEFYPDDEMEYDEQEMTEEELLLLEEDFDLHDESPYFISLDIQQYQKRLNEDGREAERRRSAAGPLSKRSISRSIRTSLRKSVLRRTIQETGQRTGSIPSQLETTAEETRHKQERASNSITSVDLSPADLVPRTISYYRPELLQIREGSAAYLSIVEEVNLALTALRRQLEPMQASHERVLKALDTLNDQEERLHRQTEILAAEQQIQRAKQTILTLERKPSALIEASKALWKEIGVRLVKKRVRVLTDSCARERLDLLHVEILRETAGSAAEHSLNAGRSQKGKDYTARSETPVSPSGRSRRVAVISPSSPSHNSLADASSAPHTPKESLKSGGTRGIAADILRSSNGSARAPEGTHSRRLFFLQRLETATLVWNRKRLCDRTDEFFGEEEDEGKRVLKMRKLLLQQQEKKTEEHPDSSEEVPKVQESKVDSWPFVMLDVDERIYDAYHKLPCSTPIAYDESEDINPPAKRPRDVKPSAQASEKSKQQKQAIEELLSAQSKMKKNQIVPKVDTTVSTEVQQSPRKEKGTHMSSILLRVVITLECEGSLIVVKALESQTGTLCSVTSSDSEALVAVLKSIQTKRELIIQLQQYVATSLNAVVDADSGMLLSIRLVEDVLT